MNTIYTYTHKINIQTKTCGCFNLGSQALDPCQGKALVTVESIMDSRIQLLWGLGAAAALRLYLGAAHTWNMWRTCAMSRRIVPDGGHIHRHTLNHFKVMFVLGEKLYVILILCSAWKINSNEINLN